MKRTSLQRKTRLQADPETTRAFVNRGRMSLSSFTAAWDRDVARAKPRQKPTKVDGKLPKHLAAVKYKAPVAARRRRCGACGRQATSHHHVLPQQALRRFVRGLRLEDAEGGAKLRALLNDGRNLLPACGECHAFHEAGQRRFTRAQLPAGVWEFCAELDAADGTQWATVLVERAHPLRDEVRP